MRACLCLYLYLCLQTCEKKDPKCTQPRWSRCTCLSLLIEEETNKRRAIIEGHHQFAKRANLGSKNISHFCVFLLWNCLQSWSGRHSTAQLHPRCSTAKPWKKIDCEMEHWTSIHWRRIKTSWYRWNMLEPSSCSSSSSETYEIMSLL